MQLSHISSVPCVRARATQNLRSIQLILNHNRTHVDIQVKREIHTCHSIDTDTEPEMLDILFYCLKCKLSTIYGAAHTFGLE